MLNGLIIVNKEKNITSFGTIKKLQNILNEEKIGHIGTLDPNATGVLVCLLNDSCKFAGNLSKHDKVYEAELIFGFSTETLDVTGKITKTTKFNKNNLKHLMLNLNKTLNSFMGVQKQIPPMISAKKINGKKLYEFGRKGKIISRRPCEITIYDIFVLKDLKPKIYNNVPVLSCIIKIHCSSGTYIRSLCDDIGRKLKINSCMGDLNRLSIGDFDIKNSYKISKINQLVKNKDLSFIKPCFYQKNETGLSIGKFETLHLGHLEIINKLKSESLRKGIKPLIFTFENNNAFSTNEEKLSRISSLGIDNIISIPFNKSISDLSAEFFFTEIIVKQLKTKLIVCGNDFCFGKGRKGDINFLKDMCNKFQIDIIVLNKKLYDIKDKKIISDAKFSRDCIVISSSNIKKYIEEGNFNIANTMLDRSYSVLFKIIDKSTLKLENTKGKILPKNGSYNIFYYNKNINYEAKLIIKNKEIFLSNISDPSSIEDIKQIKIYFKNNDEI